MNEEEKEAIETLETEGTENNYLEVKILLNLVDKQQKEIEEKTTILLAGAEKVKQLEKEIKEYKRYFKLAISDLQSEGYMQMPYENIEKYYSKREDIV